MASAILFALTRGPDRKVVATPKAIIEFENLKVVLNSPPVLQQFRYDRPTVVYTDTSVGTAELPGGLGVVIVQTDGNDGLDYVCAYASAGLAPAQKNYYIVRLELLAFVFACGKFYDWLLGRYPVYVAFRLLEPMRSCTQPGPLLTLRLWRNLTFVWNGRPSIGQGYLWLPLFCFCRRVHALYGGTSYS